MSGMSDIDRRLQVMEQEWEHCPPAYKEKIGAELAAARRAQTALLAAAKAAGVDYILALLPSSARLTVLGLRNGELVALKVSGNPYGRDGLKGEYATLDLLRGHDPNSALVEPLAHGVLKDLGVDYIVTRFVPFPRFSDDLQSGVQTDFSTTMRLLDGLRNVPLPRIPKGRSRYFKSFSRDRIAGPMDDTGGLLEAAEPHMPLIRETSGLFRVSLRALRNAAGFAGLGDAKASNALRPPRYFQALFFDPDGCNLPVGWDPGVDHC